MCTNERKIANQDKCKDCIALRLEVKQKPEDRTNTVMRGAVCANAGEQHRQIAAVSL